MPTSDSMGLSAQWKAACFPRRLLHFTLPHHFVKELLECPNLIRDSSHHRGGRKVG